jgi:hypothetical protein
MTVLVSITIHVKNMHKLISDCNFLISRNYNQMNISFYFLGCGLIEITKSKCHFWRVKIRYRVQDMTRAAKMKQATIKYRLLKTRNADNFDIETKISYIFCFFHPITLLTTQSTLSLYLK